MRLVRDRASANKVLLKTDLPADLPKVEADQRAVKQIMINLLSNAVKFTPEGGQVDVRAEIDGAEAQAIVRDSGIGIDAADHERIFEAFQRGGREARSEGTGLGLMLSKRIVELHGGRIWMASRALAAPSAFAVPAARGRSDAGEPRGPWPPSATWRPCSWSRTTPTRPSCSPRTSRAPATASRWPRTAPRASSWPAAPPRAVVLDILLLRVDGWDLLAD